MLEQICAQASGCYHGNHIMTDMFFIRLSPETYREEETAEIQANFIHVFNENNCQVFIFFRLISASFFSLTLHKT